MVNGGAAFVLEAHMMEKFESLLFVLFVASAVWLAWVPLNYTIGNLRKFDFDFSRDVAFYLDTVKAKVGTIMGKAVLLYILGYIIFWVITRLLQRGS